MKTELSLTMASSAPNLPADLVLSKRRRVNIRVLNLLLSSHLVQLRLQIRKPHPPWSLEVPYNYPRYVPPHHASPRTDEIFPPSFPSKHVGAAHLCSTAPANTL
ncbi:hypothetical protein M758_1G252200 [Ceratodon purpureus]|uniref:Uncharacterized protein n=1 Tax=Ceratodon purpureus TaxID=3225 RepID=A0A8T0JB52_CERPU|nr:hypothetical protein KC19_1G258800 [Ceratodon purpureus]KAG0631426.1 hypothetical protein M758_1G252200 [Ceratodon purpureus]